MLRVQGVTLVPPDNHAYRDHCRRMAAENRPLGRGNGFTAMLRLPYVLEAAARTWLSRGISLMPQRILTYESFERGQWRRRYRELDAVAGASGQPTVLFEVKVGHGKYQRAYRQLLASADVLEAARKGGQTLVVVFVRFDDDDKPLDVLPPDVQIVDEISHVFAAWGAGRRPLVILSARALWDEALASGQVSDPSLWDEARAEYFATRRGNGGEAVAADETESLPQAS